MPTGRLLHVTNGDSTAGTLRLTGLGGDVVPWRDALHDGPVPRGDEACVRAARARFLATLAWGAEPDLLAELEARDAALVSALTDGREVVLWFEHDLYDQLQLIQALALVEAAGVSTETARLISIDRFPGHPGFAGLGELNPRELASLWDVRQPVTSARLQGAVAAWHAFRQPDPRAVEAFAASPPPALPFLGAALVRLLEELPATVDGLGRTERQLLEALAAGATTPGALLVASMNAEEAPFLGDAWLWLRLEALSAGPRPLVERNHGAFALTDVGRGVLAGAADRVAAVGIDRWLGGVHVLGPDPWRWDRAARRGVPPATGD